MKRKKGEDELAEIKDDQPMKSWKQILILGVVIVATMISGLLINEEEVLSKSLSTVNYPEAYDFEEGQDIHKIMEENPLSDHFLEAMKEFTYETSAEIFKEAQGNMNYSPLSAYYALAMAATGAEEETLHEILSLLNVEDKEFLSEQSGNYYKRLYYDNEIGQLKITNSLWMNKDVKWKEPFLENIGKNFFAETYQLDFQKDATRRAMEKWIKENTRGTLTPEVNLDPQQILSILNTVYYYDEWTDSFDEAKTKKDSFYPSNNNRVSAEFMNSSYFSSGFARGENFTRSGLQLKNYGRMVFILPDEGTSIKDLISTPKIMEKTFQGGEEKFGEVIWQIPKFSFHTKLNLGDSLKQLGMTSAFEETANFTGITDQIAYISDVFQETNMGIDEKGVEASSYTQINYVGAAMPKDKAEMILNRPFLYGIVTPDGNLLFVGVCDNPTIE